MNPPEITVVVEQSSSRLYERLHSRLDRSNRKLYFGEPIKLRILNNDSMNDVQSILHNPGVRYVRQDVLDSIHSNVS